MASRQKVTGVCRECKRRWLLRSDGTVGMHRPLPVHDRRRPTRRKTCGGSAGFPLEGSKRFGD